MNLLSAFQLRKLLIQPPWYTPHDERRGFPHLQPVPRRRLIDSLVSNLSVLSACVDSALGSGDAETLLRHRTALKVYVFFLHWALAQAEVEARSGGATAASAPAAAKYGYLPEPDVG